MQKRSRKSLYLFAKLPLLNLGLAVVYFLLVHFGMAWLTLTPQVSLEARAWYQPSGLQIVILVIGLTLIGLLTAYLRMRQEHDELLRENQARLEADVLSQTQALRKANDWLLNEVVQRQQAQEQLQESQTALRAREQHLRSLLDNIPDPVWFKNLEGVYISCNRAFAEMLGQAEVNIIGKKEDQLVGRDLADFFSSQ